MDKQDKTNEYFEKDGKKIKRQKCEVYTRIMGYIRPISHANVGKKSEIYSRKHFVEGCVCKRDFDMITTNRDFISKYSNNETTNSVEG